MITPTPIKTRSEDLAAILLERDSIRLFWSEMADNVQKVLDASDNEWHMDTILRQVLAGEMAVWIAVDDDAKIQSFMFVMPLQTEKGWYMDLPFTWSSSFHAGSTLWELVESWAKDIGYYGVKFVSNNKKLASWAKRRGMRKRFVEYVKEF